MTSQRSSQERDVMALADEARRRNEAHQNQSGDMMYLGRPDEFLTNVEAALRRAAPTASVREALEEVLTSALSWEPSENGPSYGQERTRLEAQMLAALSAAPVERGREDRLIAFTYTNYRGERSERLVRPISIRFGSNQYHPNDGWLMLALDLEKNEEREFAMKDMERPSRNSLRVFSANEVIVAGNMDKPTSPLPMATSDIRWAVNVLLEKIAAKFEAWDTFDLFRSEAASTVRGFKHNLALPLPSEQRLSTEAAAEQMRTALVYVRGLISEAALTGFNYLDGDWPTRLFESQHYTTEAIKSYATIAHPPADRDAVAEAFIAGATAVHREWIADAEGNGDGPPRGDPEFSEAANDYAAAIRSSRGDQQ